MAVVDDDPMMLDAIECLLEILGFAAKVFSSGQAFLDNAATDEFDCVLVDIHLGDMSGFELHRQLKGARSMLPSGPWGLMTAYADAMRVGDHAHARAALLAQDGQD